MLSRSVAIAARGPIRHAAFLVCTHDRLDVLAACLDGIALQLPADCKIDVIIADNSSTSAEAQIRALCPAAHYVHQPERGYSNIRNAALTCALQRTQAEVLLCIDDDVIPKPDFVHQHIATLTETGADVSSGCTIGHKVRPDRERITRVSTYNVAIRRWIAEQIKFCPEANLIGYEDYEYFNEAHAAGAVMLHNARAMVADCPRDLFPLSQGRDIRLETLAGARNAIRIERLRRGIWSAVWRYASLYAIRLPRGLMLWAGSVVTRDAKMGVAARGNLMMHHAALGGLYLPGIDRELAKRGQLVAVT
jgi:glycosyltransferase involved in cell wall biosynthesis